MFIAIDNNEKRIDASEACKGQEYKCPICGQGVLLRDGEVNVAHFAHKNVCQDKWNYDMSEWHKKMQGFFSHEYREVVVEHCGLKHRADILEDNTVIEIQHSPISAEEFNERNEFFRKCGYRIVWIFDLREKLINNQIQYIDDNDNTKFKWSHPMRIFKDIDGGITDYGEFLSVYLHLQEDEEYTAIEKVVWTAKDEDGRIDFSKFCIREEPIIMEEIIDANEFFLSQKEIRKNRVKVEIKKLNEVSKIKGFSYDVKYIGKKGENTEKYTCNRRNKFGLKIFGEESCSYCKHCALVIEKNENYKDMYAIYCCYPYEYRKLDAGNHPGYECFEVKRLKL